MFKDWETIKKVREKKEQVKLIKDNKIEVQVPKERGEKKSQNDNSGKLNKIK